MSAWKEEVLAEVWLARVNPDHKPRYRVPARSWWQLWKPRWQWIEGVSENQVRALYKLEAIRPFVTVTRI
jgi:hypothetical protein